MKVKDILFNVPGKRIYCDVVKNYRILKTQTCIDQAKTKGFNQARQQILNSEIDFSKVIDVEKLERRIRRVELSTYEIVDDTEMGVKKLRGVMCKELAQAILTNINQCLKEEG